MEAIYEFDYSILNFIYEHVRCAFLDVFFPIVTFLADGGWFWIALAVVFLCFKKTRKMGICMGVSLLFGALVVNVTLKPLVARIRPYDFCDPNNPLRLNEYFHLAKEGLALLIEKQHDYSFPSGHTLASFEGAMAIFMCRRKWGIPALVLATLIAFSRLYLYVHYPSDVIVSLFLGIAIAVGAYFLVNFVWKKVEAKIEAKKTVTVEAKEEVTTSEEA